MSADDDQRRDDAPPAASRRRAVTNAFLLVFLAIQLALPVRGFVRDKFETRADLSWNMYSKRYSCRVNYVVHEPDGRRTRIDHKDFFRRRSAANRVLHRDVLPAFHAEVCGQLRDEGRLGRLQGSVRCMLNFGERVPLVDHTADLCTSENYGVLP